MQKTIIYYLTFVFVAPFIALIALLDCPKSFKQFKNNFNLVYGGSYEDWS